MCVVLERLLIIFYFILFYFCDCWGVRGGEVVGG